MQSRHEDDLLTDFSELISSVGTAVSENSVKPVLNKAVAEWKQHLDAFNHSLNPLVNRIEDSVKALRNDQDKISEIIKSVDELSTTVVEAAFGTELPERMEQLRDAIQCANDHNAIVERTFTRIQDELKNLKSTIQTEMQHQTAVIGKSLTGVQSELGDLPDLMKKHYDHLRSGDEQRMLNIISVTEEKTKEVKNALFHVSIYNQKLDKDLNESKAMLADQNARFGKRLAILAFANAVTLGLLVWTILLLTRMN